MYVDKPVRVYGRINVEIELSELSTSGTMLDMKGLSSAIKDFLEKMPMSGPQMNVLCVEPATKQWEVDAQLRNARPWDETSSTETPQ